MRALACLLVLAAACGDPAPPDSAPAPDSAAAADEYRMVLTSAPLRTEPAADGPVLLEVAAGEGLRWVADSTAAGVAWVRLATWDDRMGWVEAAHVVEPTQWAHYQEALGGALPIAVRPAYPVGTGALAVEAPFPSPDWVVGMGRVWTVGDSVRETTVAGLDSVPAACGGPRYRYARLATAGGLLDPRAAVLAVPAPAPPTVAAVAVEPLAADSAVRAAAGRLGAPRGAGAPALAASSLGDDAAFVALAWDDPAGDGGWTAAAVLRRETGGAWAVDPVAPLARAERPVPLRILRAWSTGRTAWPTLLLAEAAGERGSHIRLYVAGEGEYRLLYAGYPWGC